MRGAGRWGGGEGRAALPTGACRQGPGCPRPPRRRCGSGGTSRTGPPGPEQRGSGTRAGCLRGGPCQLPPEVHPSSAAPKQCTGLSGTFSYDTAPPLLTHTPGLPLPSGEKPRPIFSGLSPPFPRVSLSWRMISCFPSCAITCHSLLPYQTPTHPAKPQFPC